jgi:Uma2 family endonuclease
VATTFLKIRFASDQKAELSNGVIRMMAGKKGIHARIQRNVLAFLFVALRGSGCSPYGSDTGVRTHDLSLRYPDVSVFCGRDTPENDELVTFDDPKVLIEILSPSTRNEDLGAKLFEYRALPSVDNILFIDPESGTKRVLQRTEALGWTDVALDGDADVSLPSLGLILPSIEIFTRD